MVFCRRLCAICYWLGSVGLLLANVTSSQGNISFDVNDDGSAEMIFDTAGLGIGTFSPSAKMEVSGNAIVSRSMSIGSSSVGSANLNINGSFGLSPQTITDDSSLGSSSMVFVDTSSDNIYLALPAASSVANRSYTIKKISPNNTMTIASTDNIERSTGHLVSSGNRSSFRLHSDGNEWFVLSSSPSRLSYQATSLPLYYEQFFGLTDGAISGQGSGGGWSSSLWTSFVGTVTSYSSAFGLTHSSVPNSRGGGLEISDNGGVDGYSTAYRVFPSSLSDTGTYYFGFLLKLSATPHKAYVQIRVDGSHQAIAGVWGSADPNWSISKNDGGGYSTSNTAIAKSTSATHFVIKLTLISGTGDTAELFVDPANEAALSGASDASVTFTNDFLGPAEMRFVRQNNGGNDGSVIWDEIRVDTDPAKMFMDF
jgi:hypothetical protein